MRYGKPDLLSTLNERIVKKKLSIFSRLALAISGLTLIIVLFVPIWRIELNAPQYPEGLCLKIHANGIKGDVAIINGLNHYIGMKTLHTADFPEFSILPYAIIVFVILFIIGAIANRRSLLSLNFILFVLFGIVAMIDFWKWEYDYGHNLNPDAAIVVPGMAYQPPLIGFKQLLNFGAYSIPDTGGWLFVGCGGLLLLAVAVEWRRSVKIRKSAPTVAAMLLSVSMFTSCSSAPEPLQTGKDACAYCKMTIADVRFGAELVTSTGKKYKFDDINCMSLFMKTLETIVAEEAHKYVTDYCGKHDLVEVDKSFLLSNSEIQCPMQGHLIAFSCQDSLKTVMTIHKGEETRWGLSK